MRGAQSARNIESVLMKMAWRNMHEGDELMQALLHDTERVHGTYEVRDNLASALSLVASANFASSSSNGAVSTRFGCLCDEPVHVLAYHARDRMIQERGGKIAAINLWRAQHLQHSKTCLTQNRSQRSAEVTHYTASNYFESKSCFALLQVICEAMRNGREHVFKKNRN